MNTTSASAPNLTQRPPRSPRVRLGGYVLLPRLLDKGRAELAGTAANTNTTTRLTDTGFVLLASRRKR
jgi:hypothetical protein